MPDNIAAQHAAEFRRCLIDMDVRGAKLLWAHCFPELPQPSKDLEVVFMLHLARTEANTIPLKLRQYSHRWLRERGHGSFLPDLLKPAGDKRG